VGEVADVLEGLLAEKEESIGELIRLIEFE